MDSIKPGSDLDMLTPDKIKKEPGGDVSAVLPSEKPSLAKVSTNSGRVMTLVTSSAKTSSTSTSAQKTILLVQALNSKTGGIQSMLLPTGVSNVRSSTPKGLKLTDVNVKKTSSVLVSSLLPTSMRASTSKFSESVLSSSKASGMRVVAVPSASSQNTVSSVKLSPSIAPPLTNAEFQIPYALTFKSRTIQADGTVCAIKEFLCNFCQFKIASSSQMEKHFLNHLFSCIYCSFRCTSRLDLLCHKRDSHPVAAEELAGYEDLDRPALIARVHKMPNMSNVPFGSNPVSVPISMSAVKLAPKSIMSTSLSSSTSVGTESLSTVVTTLANSVAKMNTTPSSSVVMRSSGKPGDSYFTYRIVHDSDGKVQSYECDSCAYQTIRLNDMFAHVSTHSLAELNKSCSSGANEIMWECFYCPFVASQQVAVVGHVIASHPNKPIQLKRVPSVGEGRSGTTPSVPGSVLFIPSSKQDGAKDNGLLSDKKPSTLSDKQLDLEKKKKLEVEDQCIWGCYYCSMTSPSRNDIICHLKKDHATEKLVVTRRRLARMDSADVAAASVVKSPDKPVTNEVSEKVADKFPIDSGTNGKGDSRAKRKRATVADGTDVQIGDIDSTEANQATAKSRRKQVAPRKVADEGGDTVVTETGKQNLMLLANSSPAIDPSGEVSAVMKDVKKPETVGGGRKHGRSMSKYDGLIKKLKMADSEQNADSFTSSLLLEKLSRTAVDSSMPDLEKNGSSSNMMVAGKAAMPELQKNGSNKVPCSPADAQKLKSPVSSGTKALSLLTGQLVSGYVKPPSKHSSASSDRDMPVLHREDKSSPDGPIKSDAVLGTGLKVSVVKVVNVPSNNKRSESLLNFVYDSEANSARCGICGTSAYGLNVLQRIREHVAVHFNECKWACTYCPFQCNQRVAITKHMRHRHIDRPLRLVRRKPCKKVMASKSVAPLAVDVAIQRDGDECQDIKRKLRGPRSKRELKFAAMTDTVWQCPFCSRRSCFRGFMNIHIQLAHPEVDFLVPAQRWTLNPMSDEELKLDTKSGCVSLVRVEDVQQFARLSEITESNGEKLLHELDVDDKPEIEMKSSNSGDDLLEFRCLQCHYRGANPAIVKCHILHSHPDDDVTILDMRTSRRMNHEHVFMCKSVVCQFMSTVPSEIEKHLAQKPSHSTNKLLNLQSAENKVAIKPSASPETRSRTRVGNKMILASPARRSDQYKSNAARAVDGPEAVIEMASRSRLTTDGDIEYNDDGTIKGVQLINDSFDSPCMQCQHCEQRCTDLDQMKIHLCADHPSLDPLAIDVNAAIAGYHSWLFFCAVNGCDFVANHYNVYKHHMDIEHPDSEIGFASKNRPNKRRTVSGGGASSRKSSSSVRDATYSANVRTTNRRSVLLTDVLSESTNDSSGAISPSTSRSDSGMTVESINSPATTGFDFKTSNRSYHSTKQNSKFDFSCRYECVLCSLAVATLADMKSHLLAAHDTSVVHQCIDRRARQLRKRQKILFCPQSVCSYCCKLDDDLARHIEVEHAGPVAVTIVEDPLSGWSSRELSSAGDSRVYQCSSCTFITTESFNMKEHVLEEHGDSSGSGFAEIKTTIGVDGNLVMKVNDATTTSDDNSSQELIDGVTDRDESLAVE